LRFVPQGERFSVFAYGAAGHCWPNDAYVDQFAEERDERGHRLVERNGYHEARSC
jgi:hypothetical protein